MKTIALLLAAAGACSTTPAPTPPDVTIPPTTATPALSADVAPSAIPAATALPKPSSSAIRQAAAPCETSKDCRTDEICAGDPGCDKVWTCVPARPCTRDLTQFCGCDAQTFASSSTCPLKKYRSRGACTP